MEQSLSDVVGHSGLIALATYAIMVALVPQDLFTVMVMGTGLMDMRPAVVLIVSRSGPGCSKLTTSLVNDSLKFQTLISQICQYFWLKKCEKLLHCKSFSHFFNKKFQCIWL